MIRKYSTKELQSIPLDELEKRYWELTKLSTSVEKSRPHLDPTFCSNCLRSCNPDRDTPFPVSDCCVDEMVDKNKIKSIIEGQAAIAAERLRANSKPLRKKKKRGRKDVRAGMTSTGTFKMSKARRTPTDPAQEVTVILNDVSFTFPTRKRLRKYLREHGTSITQFEENAEGILVQMEE